MAKKAKKADVENKRNIYVIAILVLMIAISVVQFFQINELRTSIQGAAVQEHVVQPPEQCYRYLPSGQSVIDNSSGKC